MAESVSVLRFYGLAGHVSWSSQLRSSRLKLGVDRWLSPKFPIGAEAIPGLSDPGTSLEGFLPSPLLWSNIPASKAPAIL
jgi:hypothetical protein